MNRFHFLFSATVLSALLATSCAPQQAQSALEQPTPHIRSTPTILDHEPGSPASAARLSDERPNIIVVLTDDQPYHTVDYMPEVKGFLMANGVVFENGFVTTPLCCPSRASILTGEYAHNHHVYTNGPPLGGAQKFDDTSTLAVWLQETEYRTAYYGKYMNGYEQLTPFGYVPPGWDDWGVFIGNTIGPSDYYFDFELSENGAIVRYPRSEENFSTDVLTRKALTFINESRDQPFLMFVAYSNSHSPTISAPRHNDAFLSESDSNWSPYRPPNLNEKNIKDKPKYLKKAPRLREQAFDGLHKRILRSLLSVDDGVASMVDMLAQTNLTQKTIIIYLSDNGFTLGDNRLGVGKNCPYEACVRVPLIVYAPGYYAARTDPHLVANIDLAPTIAEWAGAPIPGSVNGLSLVPLLQNPQAPWREEILLEHWPDEQNALRSVPEFYSIRTPEWKYTEYSTGEVELYNLVNDPYELDNLAGQGSYENIQHDLAAKLQQLKAE